MDSNGSFQSQNLKFVACKARLASGDASDTRISRPSQHAKAHGLCGNDTHRHDAIRRATRMGKRAPPHPGAVHLSKKCPAPPRNNAATTRALPANKKLPSAGLAEGRFEGAFQLATGYYSPLTSFATASSSASTPAAERSSPPWQNFLSTQPVRIGARIAVMMTAVAIWA